MRGEVNNLIKYAADVVYFHHNYGKLHVAKTKIQHLQVNVTSGLLDRFRELVKFEDVPGFALPVTNRRSRDNFGAPGPIVYYHFRKHSYENAMVVSGRPVQRMTAKTDGNRIVRVRFWKEGLPDMEVQTFFDAGMAGAESGFVLRILNMAPMSIDDMIGALNDYHVEFDKSSDFVSPLLAEAYNRSPMAFRGRHCQLTDISGFEAKDEAEEALEGVPSLLRLAYNGLTARAQKQVGMVIEGKLTLVRVPKKKGTKRKRLSST